MIRIHQMAKAYHRMPCEILFPKTTFSPMVELAINNIIFEIGYKDELELEKLRIELENKRIEAMLSMR